MNLHYRGNNGEDRKFSAADEQKYKKAGGGGPKFASSGKKAAANQPSKVSRSSKGKR